MPDNALAASTANTNYLFLPESAGKDTRHRIQKYVSWLEASGLVWLTPDLRFYRDYLLNDEGLAPESVSVHLSSVRSRYRELLRMRQLFFELVPAQATFAEHKAVVDELIARIENAIDPRSARVRTRDIQDHTDSDHLRLTHEEARQLLSLPDTSTLVGKRDKAVISLLLCTGVREQELCSLEIRDLNQRLRGENALHIRFGKGMKERLVPYGDFDWCLRYVNSWLAHADIHAGPVFRGLRKGDNVRSEALNERTVQKILARYPIMSQDRLTIVKPHDCRRTYARWLYDAGVKIDAIRQNLGHNSIEMTFRYIGPPDVADRLPPAVFTP